MGDHTIIYLKNDVNEDINKYAKEYMSQQQFLMTTCVENN